MVLSNAGKEFGVVDALDDLLDSTISNETVFVQNLGHILVKQARKLQDAQAEKLKS